MIRVFFAEWRKLRRPVLFFGTMFAVVGFTALITSLLFLMIDSTNGNSRQGQTIHRVTLESAHGLSVGFSSAAGFLGLIALCIFASQTAQEYTHGTLRNLLVRQPRRLTLLAGKFLAMCLFAFVSVVLSAIVSIALAFALSGKAKVVTTAWSTSAARTGLMHTFVNVLVSVIAFGTIGMILGLLLRSPIAAISIGVGWLLVVENILAATLKSSAKWLPGQMASVVATGGNENGFALGASYPHALWVLAAYLSVGVLVAGYLFHRRDVTN